MRHPNEAVAGSNFPRLPFPFKLKLTSIKLIYTCAWIRCFYSLLNKQITSNRNSGTALLSVQRGSRSRNLFWTCTDNIYLTYTFIMRFVCFGLFIEEGRILEEFFLSNCFFCRSNICCFALTDSSERLQLRDSKDSAECSWNKIWSFYDYLIHLISGKSLVTRLNTKRDTLKAFSLQS